MSQDNTFDGFNRRKKSEFFNITAPTGNTMAVPTGESLMNDPQYQVQGGSGGGGLSDIIPQGVSKSSLGEFYQDNQAMIGNVIGGGSMAIGGFMASKNIDNAMGDIDKAIGDTASLITDSITETDNTIDNLNTQLAQLSNTASENANTKLSSSFDKINKQKSNIGGGMLTAQRDKVRRTLSNALDNTVDTYRLKTDAKIDQAYNLYRDDVRKVENIREELRAKKSQLEDEKRKAQTGAVLGVLSVGADLVLPGSGQAIRTGAKAYQTYG